MSVLQPLGIATDGTNLYVTDAYNYKIRKIVLSSGAVTPFAGPPAGTRPSGDTDNDTPSNAKCSGPFGITSDGINLFVKDNIVGKLKQCPKEQRNFSVNFSLNDIYKRFFIYYLTRSKFLYAINFNK